MEEAAGNPGYQALPTKDPSNPPVLEQEEDAGRKKQQELEALQVQLEQMSQSSQSSISEAELNKVDSACILTQLSLNVFGLVLFCFQAIWVQITYMPRHACLMLLFEGLLFMISCVILGVLVELLVHPFLENRTWGTWRDSSSLLNRLCGWENLILHSKFELYALTHAINKDAIFKDGRSLLIGTVRTNNSTTAQKVISFGNPPQELPPAIFWAENIWTRDHKRELIESFKTLPALSYNFFDDELAKLSTTEDFPCTARLKRRFYWMDLMLHPVGCMVVWVAVAVVMLTPVTFWAYQMFGLHVAVCQERGQHHRDLQHLGTVLAIEGEELVALCSHFENFAQVVHKELHVSDMELILTCVLVLVMLALGATLRTVQLNARRRARFVSQSADTTMRERLFLHAQVDCMGRILGPMSVLRRMVRLLCCLMERPRVCSPLERLDRPTDWNQSFKILVKPILQVMYGEDVIEVWNLPPCDEERPKCRRKWAEKAQVAKTIWEEKRVGLGLNRFRSAGYKLTVFVPITCAESLELFKKEFLGKSRMRGGYKEQLQQIFATDRAQEALDESVTLGKPLRMGPLIVPPGFALTHVAVELPDGSLSSAVVGRMGKRERHHLAESHQIDSPEKFEELLDCCKDDTESKATQAVRLKGFYNRFGSVVILQRASSSTNMSDLWKLYGDDAVYAFFFVFQLAHNPKGGKGDSPAGPQGDPLRQPFRHMEAWTEVAPQRQEYADFKAMPAAECWPSLFFAIRKLSAEEVLKEMAVLFRANLLGELLLALVSAAIVLAIPALRHFRGRVTLFPEPFATPLVQNAVVQFLALYFFMSFFLRQTRTLKLINLLLTDFETRTRSSSTIIKGKQGQQDDAENADEARLKLDPFALVLQQKEESSPSDKTSLANWRSCWADAGQNVENWHRCQSTLRLVLSTTRQTSHALIVLAFILLGTLLISSFVQALNGKGAVTVDSGALADLAKHDLHAKLREGVSSGSAAIRSAVEGISGATSAATGQAGSTRRLMEAAHGGQEADTLRAAEEDLRRAVAPFYGSLHGPVIWQAEELEAEQRRLSALDHAASYLSTVQAVQLQEISKTQVLLLVLLGPLLFLSSRLVLQMAEVNEAFDGHESLLVEQKTQHQRLQTARKAKPASGQGGTEAEADADASHVKDAVESYEKMLDVAIEASRHGQKQHPLMLFGYVINYPLLLIWVVALGLPLLKQLQAVLPHILEGGCTLVEDYALSGLQGRLDYATNFTNNAFEGAKTGHEDLIPHITLKDLFHNSICTPLVTALAGQLQGLEQKAEAHSTAGPAPTPAPALSPTPAGHSTAASRRLGLLQVAEGAERRNLAELPLALQSWWAAHDSLEPMTKLALAQLQLQCLRRSAFRLLQEAPQAVVDAYAARGLPAALAVARHHRDEAATEPLPSLSLAVHVV